MTAFEQRGWIWGGTGDVEGLPALLDDGSVAPDFARVHDAALGPEVRSRRRRTGWSWTACGAPTSTTSERPPSGGSPAGCSTTSTGPPRTRSRSPGTAALPIRRARAAGAARRLQGRPLHDRPRASVAGADGPRPHRLHLDRSTRRASWPWRAAAQHGLVYTLSTLATRSIEEVCGGQHRARSGSRSTCGGTAGWWRTWCNGPSPRATRR